MQKRPIKPVLVWHTSSNNGSGIHLARRAWAGISLAALSMILTAPSANATATAAGTDAVHLVSVAQSTPRNTCMDPLKTGPYRGFSAARTKEAPAIPNGCVYYTFVGSLEANIREMLEQHEYQHYEIDPRISCAEFSIAAPYTVSGESVPQLLANFLRGFPLKAVIHKPDGFVRVQFRTPEDIPGHCGFGVGA